MFGTGEKHNEAVNADAAAAGWGHSAFEGIEELLVHGVGFVVAFVSLAELLFEPLPLVEGVVDFAESVANFSTEDVAFEPAGEPGAVRVLFSERGCFDRVADNEGGFLEVGFDEVFEEFFDDATEVVFFLGGESDSLHGGFGVVHTGEFFRGNAGLFVDRGHEVNAVPGLAEIYVLDVWISKHFLRNVAEKVFDARHHVFEIGVGFVPLEEGELGVVAIGNALIAEDAANFVHLGYVAADDALEVELKRDAELNFQIVGVVVGFERAGGGTTSFELEERGFDFEVAAGIKESADFADDAGAVEQHFPGFFVCNEIEVAVAVSLINVRQAVPLLAIFFFAEGEIVESFAEGGQAVSMEGGLSGSGFEQRAGDADVVADVEKLEGFPGVGVEFFKFVFAEIDLDPFFAVGEVGEGGLAHETHADETSGEADAGLLFSWFVFAEVGEGVEAIEQVFGGMINLKFLGGVGV